MRSLESELAEAFLNQRITALRLGLRMIELVPDGTPVKDVRKYAAELRDIERLTPTDLLIFINDTERALTTAYAKEGKVFKL